MRLFSHSAAWDTCAAQGQCAGNSKVQCVNCRCSSFHTQLRATHALHTVSVQLTFALCGMQTQMYLVVWDICRVGHNCIFTLYITIHLVISMPKIPYTVQTLYHRAKISFFALRGDCAHEKYLFILGVRDLITGIFGVFWNLSGKNPCAGLV